MNYFVNIILTKNKIMKTITGWRFAVRFFFLAPFRHACAGLMMWSLVWIGLSVLTLVTITNTYSPDLFRGLLLGNVCLRSLLGRSLFQPTNSYFFSLLGHRLFLVTHHGLRLWIADKNVNHWNHTGHNSNNDMYFNFFLQTLSARWLSVLLCFTSSLLSYYNSSLALN